MNEFLSQGDSGGPLNCQSSVNGKWYNQGVASFFTVVNCIRGSHYGATHSSLDWIHATMERYSTLT